MLKQIKCKGFSDKYDKCANTAPYPNEIQYCNNCAGKYFESQVSRLFSIQGYDITNNIKLSSTQNDIYAKLKYGILEVGVLIECKWKFNKNDTVKSSDVRKFFGTFEIFNKQGLFGYAQKAFLVTNGKFAPEAYEAAKNILCLELYTYNELINKLINFNSYLKSMINKYKTSNLFGHYVALRVKTEDYLFNEELDCIKEYEEDDAYDLMDTVDKLLINSSNNALVVLGDYGTGKSSFCLKLCCELAEKTLLGKDVPTPILIELRDYAKSIDMENLITDILVNRLKIPNGSFETFQELLNNGYFLLIFDGFDEVSRRVDYPTKYKVFTEICRFASNNSKVLVTCRPNFFNQNDEFKKIFKSSPLYFEPNRHTVQFIEVEIVPLTVNQIKEYIISYKSELESQGLSVAEFMDIVSETHDLFDLAQRPVLLSIIISTIPELILRKGRKINEAILYDQYTRYWLEREEQKGKTLIKSTEKRLFTQELSWKMFITNELSIHYSNLPSEIISYFKINNAEDIDHFSHDIKSCSFLNREDGYYKFIHKSFMEYFVSNRIIDELYSMAHSKGDLIRKAKKFNRLFGSSLITLEIGHFLHAILDTGKLDINVISNLIAEILFYYKDLNPIALKNAVSILCKTGDNISPFLQGVKDMEGSDLSYGIFYNSKFKNINFIGANFYSANMSDIKFEDCLLVNTILAKTNIKNVVLNELSIEASDLSLSRFENCSFVDTSLAYSNVCNTFFKDCDFTSSELTELTHNEETVFSNCQNLNSVIGMPYTLKF